MSPEEFNNQLNTEFAILKVRNAALDLMDKKLSMLITINEKGVNKEVSEEIKLLIDKITKFPV